MTYCGVFLSYVVLSAAVTSSLTSTTAHGDVCLDKIDCSSYNTKRSCCGIYESWARANCRETCKFCTPKVTTPPVCTNSIDNCHEYGDDLCTNPTYKFFVQSNCAGYCHLCEQAPYIPECARHGTSATETTVTTSTESISESPTSTLQQTEPSTTPAKTTASSTTTKPETSSQPLQSTLQQTKQQQQTTSTTTFLTSRTTSTTDKYTSESPTSTLQQTEPSTTPARSTATSTTTTCFHAGLNYTKGDGWYTEHCLHWCECTDPHTNHIECGPKKCPNWTPSCDLVFHRGHCCPVLKCPDNNKTNSVSTVDIIPVIG